MLLIFPLDSAVAGSRASVQVSELPQVMYNWYDTV